jgi:hypothetical protein
MKIGIATDHAGYALKEQLKKNLTAAGQEVRLKKNRRPRAGEVIKGSPRRRRLNDFSRIIQRRPLWQRRCLTESSG